MECSQGFFLGSNTLCQQVDPLCKTFNASNGFCTSCYGGFTLVPALGKCQISPPTNSGPVPVDCNQFDYAKNICTKCIEGSYFSSPGVCQKYTDANCKVPSSDLKSCA